MDWITPFGQLRLLQGTRVATLLGLLILRRPVINSQACKYAFSHCMSVRVTHELQHGAARREQERIRRPSSLCHWAHKQHMGLVAEGAHTTMQAEAGRTGDRRPLVLPSHNDKRVAPNPELGSTADLR